MEFSGDVSPSFTAFPPPRGRVGPAGAGELDEFGEFVDVQPSTLGYNLAGFGFAPYGPYWRDIRKLVVIELLSAHRLEQFKHVRVSEIDTSIKELYRMGKTNQPDEAVEITSWVEQMTLNIITRMISGKRYFDRSSAVQDPGAGNFRRAIKEFMYVSGNFFSSDVIPYPPFTWVDWGGKLRNVKRITLIVAGADTGSINLTWLLSILLNNQPALARAKEEIDAQIGKTRLVEECDVKNLVYLQAILKEALRLYQPGPLSVPHLATADCEIGGYHIPKGTRLLPNVWKLHRDPRVWPNPGNHAAGLDVSGKNFEYGPFRAGRRSCPGLTLAMQVAQLALARLVQGFEFATPGDEAVDMSEGLGIALPKVKPVEVLITPRLASDLYEG
ncbi:hypothetical protein RHGRI_002705 [Rhododendron griersonianum]|uniref:Cytochrome P450 n=1 Tax=Rhododendron griersonianum TaxID=479676 RepID=A0AAV6LQ21_9ERIC|nr:hypothetical protein RHGRI_002705 [Rhododendron griersonianum]